MLERAKIKPISFEGRPKCASSPLKDPPPSPYFCCLGGFASQAIGGGAAGGEPVLGVVYCPALSPPVMYKGVKGDGPPVKV